MMRGVVLVAETAALAVAALVFWLLLVSPFWWVLAVVLVALLFVRGPSS